MARPTGIIKKGAVLASARLAASLDRLSKAALLDLVVDLARGEAGGLGEEADDDAVEFWVLRRFAPVSAIRDDRLPYPRLAPEPPPEEMARRRRLIDGALDLMRNQSLDRRIDAEIRQAAAEDRAPAISARIVSVERP